jgi:hypothetical protein
VLGLAAAGVLSEREAAPVRAGLDRMLGEGPALGIGQVPDGSAALAASLDDAFAEVASAAADLAARRVGGRPAPSSEGSGAQRRVLARAVGAGLFDPGRRRSRLSVREPDEVLRRQARALAADLRRARYRAPHTATVRSQLPPGRLHLAELLRQDAQRAARAAPTARPWRQLRRRDVEQPPLRVGLSWDVSRSRAESHQDMADLAWVLAWAMAHSAGTLAAVAWNSRVVPVVWPGRLPAAVVEPVCEGRSGGCAQSVRALDGVLDLADDRGLRVLVVSTDLSIGNRRFVDDEMGDLARRGVQTLWVTPEPDPRTPPGAVNLAPGGGRDLVGTVSKGLCTTLSRCP